MPRGRGPAGASGRDSPYDGPLASPSAPTGAAAASTAAGGAGAAGKPMPICTMVHVTTEPRYSRVEVLNDSGRTMHLKGWSIRAQRAKTAFFFPEATVLKPGETIGIVAGKVSGTAEMPVPHHGDVQMQWHMRSPYEHLRALWPPAAALSACIPSLTLSSIAAHAPEYCRAPVSSSSVKRPRTSSGRTRRSGIRQATPRESATYMQCGSKW